MNNANSVKVESDLQLFITFQDYTLQCEFGTATADFSHTGRVVEKSTFGRRTDLLTVNFRLNPFSTYTLNKMY